MKLCWLIPDDRGGGVAPVAMACCRQAAMAGHEVTLLTMLTPVGWVGANSQFRVASLSLDEASSETPAYLLKWLEESPQDVIFLNSCKEFDAVVPYLPPTIKCVYVVHDTAAGYWRTAVAEEDNIEAIVAVSKTVADKFRRKLKTSEKLIVVLNGCDFPALPESGNPRHNDVIFLGGSNPVKGAFDVLRLWEQLVKLGFDGNLHWFGEVTPGFRRLINKLSSIERIHVYGHVRRDIIFSTAASSKVLLMLSRVEAFGMATIEAMSMGCVPVAWNIETGTKEIIEANRTGLLSPLGRTRDLAHHVLHACHKYESFSEAVIEHARTNFSDAAMWRGYQSLINKISGGEVLNRSKYNQSPTAFVDRTRYFQLLPSPVRFTIRKLVGRSPRLGHWLRDMRGW